MNAWKSYYIRFEQYLLLERSLSKNSISAYADDVQKLEHHAELFLNHQLPSAYNFKQLQNFVEWLAELGFSASTQSRVISGIKTFFKFLVLENDIQTSSAELLETPKLKRKLPVFLNVVEIDAMFAQIDRSSAEGERNLAMLETLYSCGLRVSELVGMQITDLYFNEEYIK
ncbi:MAG: site-specific integrase, partial [Bacteroidota bacterium]